MKEFRNANIFCGANAYSYANYLQQESLTKYQAKPIEVYRPLQDAYRPFTVLYNHCRAGSVSLSQDLTVRCPSCYYNLEERRTASLDACFGAVGKRQQNHYPTESFFSTDYLLPDLPKETVIASEPIEDTERIQSVCGERRSTRGRLTKAGYYDGLNETGLCGSICKHGVPLYFINIRFGGEKMIFPATILEKLLLHDGPVNELLLKYDSICTFELWLEVCYQPADYDQSHSF